jgi:hypothetical protein
MTVSAVKYEKSRGPNQLNRLVHFDQELRQLLDLSNLPLETGTCQRWSWQNALKTLICWQSIPVFDC